MDLKEAMEWGAEFQNVEPQEGLVFVEVEIDTAYFNWVDISKANVQAMRLIKAWNGRWTLEFSFNDENGVDIRDLWPKENNE